MSSIETYYLIDFENVHGNGLLGLEALGKHDHVYLFYTKNAARIDLKEVKALKVIDCNLYEVPLGKQSLDMHLVSCLGYLIGANKECKCKYVIVSKDTGYNNIISFWKDQNISGVSSIICRKEIAVIQKESQSKKTITTISANTFNRKSNATNISKKKTQLNTEIQQILSDAGYYGDTINKIASIVVKHYGKDTFARDVHNELVYIYDDGRDIYQDIRPILEGYKTK